MFSLNNITLQKLVRSCPDKNMDLKNPYSFLPQKNIWDYCEDQTIDRKLREYTYYFAIGYALVYIKIQNDKSYSTLISNMNYMLYCMTYCYDKKNYSGVKTILNSKLSIQLIKIGQDYLQEMNQTFPY